MGGGTGGGGGRGPESLSSESRRVCQMEQLCAVISFNHHAMD